MVKKKKISPWLTEAEVARCLGRTIRHVQRLIKEGHLEKQRPGIRGIHMSDVVGHGAVRVFTEEEAEKWLQILELSR